MSIAKSFTSSTGSPSGREAMGPRYSFIQQSENVTASKTCRAVRSHAMRAVKRQQRQEIAKPIRLKWPEEPSHSERPQLTRLDGQSSTVAKREKMAQLQELMQVESLEGGLIGGTSVLKRSEPLESPNEHDAQGIIFHDLLGHASGATRSLNFQERQHYSPYTSTDVAKGATPNLTHPRTPLGEGRVDPFQTSPLHINHNLAKLIDHCEFHSQDLHRPETICGSMF